MSSGTILAIALCIGCLVREPSQQNSPSEDVDEFLPIRATGCHYRGKDSPTMTQGRPGEHKLIEFYFRGASVDRSDHSSALTQWHYWSAVSEYFVPAFA
jgi:hypothetical protein